MFRLCLDFCLEQLPGLREFETELYGFKHSLQSSCANQLVLHCKHCIDDMLEYPKMLIGSCMLLEKVHLCMQFTQRVSFLVPQYLKSTQSALSRVLYRQAEDLLEVAIYRIRSGCWHSIKTKLRLWCMFCGISTYNDYIASLVLLLHSTDGTLDFEI